jgi:hypothetical protein
MLKKKENVYLTSTFRAFFLNATFARQSSFIYLYHFIFLAYDDSGFIKN